MKTIPHVAQRTWEYLSVEHIPWLYAISCLLAVIGGVAVAILSGFYIVAGAIVGAVPLVVLVVRYPRLWLYLCALSLYFWLRSSDKDLSLIEVFSIAFYLGGLGLWFAQNLVRRKPVTYNNADRIILWVFGIVAIGNIGIAWFYGSSLLLWVREFLLLCFVLFYFPIREYFTDTVYIKRFLVILSLVVFALGVTNIQLYIEATSNALLAAELFNSRVSLNETVFVAGTIYSIVAFLYAKRFWGKALLLLLAVYYGCVLLVSMSRGPWLSCIVGIIIVFFFVDKRRKVKLSMLMTTSIAIVIAVIVLFFGHIGSLILNGIEMRFLSSTKGTQDISLKSRVMESQAALHVLSSYPWAGTGMGGTFSYYEPIKRHTVYQSMVHNGYVFIAFKLGVPLAILFFVFFFLYFFYGVRVIRRLSIDSFYKNIAISGTGTLASMLILNIPADQFVLRDGVFFIAFHIGFIAIAQRSFNERVHTYLSIGDGVNKHGLSEGRVCKNLL